MSQRQVARRGILRVLGAVAGLAALPRCGWRLQPSVRPGIGYPFAYFDGVAGRSCPTPVSAGAPLAAAPHAVVPGLLWA